MGLQDLKKWLKGEMILSNFGLSHPDASLFTKAQVCSTCISASALFYIEGHSYLVALFISLVNLYCPVNHVFWLLIESHIAENVAVEHTSQYISM